MTTPSPLDEAEEKDSLFSDKSEDKAVKIQTPEAETSEHVKVSYTDEDLDKLVGFVRNLTTLYDLRPDDWKEENYEVIKRFFLTPTEPILTIYFVNDDLICSLGPPVKSVMDLTYFLRQPFEVFEVATFFDNINFGTMDDNIEGSILNIVENIYAPVFFKSNHWPESVKNDFSHNLHMFLSKFTDVHSRLFGLTVLYIPREALDIPVDVASLDKELVKRMEAIVVYWTKQIRVGLQDQDQNTPDDLLTPLDEYDFWVYRFENLSGLNYQLTNESLKHICNILIAVQSTYVHQFLILADEIERNVKESMSNIEYLAVLRKPCTELSEIENPNEMHTKLAEILHLIRFIWMNSPYYNTIEKITSLCRALSNQVILQCTKYINMDILFEEKKSREGIKMFETCIECLTNYIRTYVLISESHTMFGPSPWLLDKAPIFNHVDSFIQRCKDMIEICEAMINFGRHDETEEIPKPNFGGSRRIEFLNWCNKVEDMFAESLKSVQEVKHLILDVQVSTWYDQMLQFKNRMKDIEVVIENLTNAVFEEVANVEEGIESLAALYNYSKRESLKALFDGKTLFVYEMFKEEIHGVKKELTESEMYPARLPYYAGRAMIANMKKNRLVLIRKFFDDAKWMLPCSVSQEIFSQYEKLVSSIDERILGLYRKWNDRLGEDVAKRLHRPLMCKSISKPGLLECNIDRSLLEIFTEARYWESLNYEVPSHIKSVYDKANNVRFVYESVLAVVLDYNKILASLSDDERLLFKPLITIVEKKIAPGLSKLTWASEVSDEYIAECSHNTAELQQFLDDYKSCNLQIVTICEKVCDTYMFRITPNYVFNIRELIIEISTQLEKTMEKLVIHYQNIIQFLILVFEGFENYMTVMANQWITYINNFDTLVEEALKISCRNTLNHMYECLHGDDTLGPNPVLELTASLKANRINFEPTLSEVAKVVHNILPNMVEALTTLPRLNDKFHVAETDFTPYWGIIEQDAECQKIQKMLNDEMSLNVKKIQEYMTIWEPFRDLWEIDKDLFMTKYETENPTAAQFDANIGRYTEVANNVQIQEGVTVVHFIRINCSELKKSIIEHCLQWQMKLCQLLYKLTVRNIDDVYEYIKVNTEAVLKEPQNLIEMEKAIALHERLVNEVSQKEETFPFITDQMLVLEKYNVSVSNEVRNREKAIPNEWSRYLDVLSDADKMLGYSKDTFKTRLLEDAEVLKKDGKKLLDDFLATGPFSSDWSAEDALKYIADIKAKLAYLREHEKDLRGDLGIFGLSLPDTIELTKLEREIAAIELVWQLTDEWNKAWEKYKSGEFWTIETEEMEVTAQTLFRKLTRLSRELKDKNWEIVDHTRQRVDAFRRTLPLIGDLKNPSMRPRHWDRVRKVVGKDFDENGPEFNLEAIYAMEMHKYAEEINDISNAATMELQIEKGLANIAHIWKDIKIEMVPHKDKGLYRIKSVEECFQTLEDHMLQLSTMKSTRFVEPFAKEVDYWERTLSYILETLEAALTVQRQWLYLENIFFGEDIRKQLPRESEGFDRLSEEWKNITIHMHAGKTAMKATQYEPAPYLYNKLNRMNDKLELIQRALERYLETKRHIFPRFYFISNDDMLEILGNSKKPEAVQPHLKKLFDNLTKLKMQRNLVTGKQEAMGMFSEDGEYMDFTKLIVLDGPVEMWLLEVEAQMRAALKKEFKPCRSALKKMLSKRDKWLLSYCGQLCNACSQIQWTTDCTKALVHAKITDSKKPLKKLRKKQNQVLSKLSELSRRELTKLQRLKANALITIEIHSRDVIDKMYKANCRDTNSFEWFSQLRFYWDRDLDDCVIKQTNTAFMYGYEYNGNSGRLVITPLTDRCYITLTTALHLFRGGSPKGPAGTGKTETVKDLGKAMGMWVIVNNCSEGLDYKSMGKCFSGLAQTGAWGCFDEFNRINIEVLSVVAQQILSILSAIARKMKQFVFEGTEINLKLTCGIFITMNPGYAGRTELPDNLKSMFRPISMMVPDSAIIAENILFSDGFQNTKTLSKKVFTLYQLAMQQLSKQDHYDFGLRSMVALLRYGGRKRRQFPHFPEDEIIYLAMRDMNIARLTSDDLPLFNGIMSDIFPGVSIPKVDYVDMTDAIVSHMKENGLQPIENAITKIIQLYETKSSRHSVMILGQTGSAKSTTWKTLQGALGILHKAGKPGFNVVHVYAINPKALNLGELYGEYNLSTNEWLDGVISAVMRTTCAEETPDEKWILFDGPVDAVWIENMNSVMDDNKILTLINSDRITMPEQVSLLFEVGDLSVASPATVSRCGMVYNDYKDWGWLPYVTSWVQKQHKRGKEFQDIMMDFFHVYLQKILDFKRLHCEEAAGCVELNLVMSLCKLLEILATVENGVNPHDEDNFADMAKNWFLFCLIWSVCCTTNEEGRKKIDNFIREKEGVFPIKDTIYEYFVDVPNKSFALWEVKLPYDWKYDPGCAFFEIIVPTVDTVRYEYITNALLSHGYPVLLTGPVGTSKTSTAQSVLASLSSEKYTVLNINMSAQTSSLNLQEAIESRLEKRTKGVYAPVGGKLLITFLDDLNMPAKETYGSQPPLELLRQWLDYNFWYDRQKQTKKFVINMHILAAMGPPGGGRNVISERLLSIFNVINITFPDETNILRIYGTMLGQHLADFNEVVKIVGREITETTIDLYNNVTAKMLPTPTKIHYLFNLRDISRIFQGLLRIKSKLANAAKKAGVFPTSEAMYNFLIKRVRANLHIIICMSPIGDAFRNRLRQYPALVNCTTIDWFCEWPKVALLEVANKYITDVNFVQTITGEVLGKRRASVLLSSQDRLREAVASTFATIHDSVAKCARRMAIEMKRHSYVTPTNYLELVAGYKKMLQEKRDEVSAQANKLRNGLWKIEDCRNKVQSMSIELEEAQVKVAEFQQQCDEYLVIIVAQRKQADEQQKEVTQKSIKIREDEVQCQKLADVAQADLDEAMPALEEAIRALDSLSKKDISEMKSYGKPPAKVEMVMEAIMILKQVEPTWAESKRQLGEINFLKDLKDFDKNHISDRTLKKVANYTQNPEFIPEKVGTVSFAAKSLCQWVIAIEKYARVWKIVEPKQMKFDEAMASLREKQAMLAEAQAKLAELNIMLARLQKEYEEKLEQKEELNRKAELLKIKLERAYILVECLAGEKTRWEETVAKLDISFDCLPGDCLLATAFLSYLGPYVSNYREELMEMWKNEVATLEIPYSTNFEIISFLTDPTTVREWNLQGLPADGFSTENGIIVTTGQRWPLVIDPQCQAQKWIKNMEAVNNLKVVDFGMHSYMKILEDAVQNGKPVLLQNILETMDPSLNSILAKAVVKQGGMNLIKIDDKMVSYNDDFRFFITTKLTNPHYPPEISTKTTLVNFAVKEQGLEAQLLGIVVRKERPQLEEQKDKLVTAIAKGKRQLIDLENELLRLLNETRGSLLEDAELFNTLQTSKATSIAVAKSLETAETTEVQIDMAREGYRPCAERASILFFVLNDLGRIDPMYQFALDSYIFLFEKSIQNSTKSQILSERIMELNDYHTYSVYRNTCRTLFEHHKLMFSFHMCVKILENMGKVVKAEYNFLLRGGVVLDKENQMDNPCAAWLSDEGWDNITELDKIAGFHGIIDTFEQYPREWHAWYTHTEPETLPLIAEWNEICNNFQKMLFIRSLRQDRMSFCITNFIINQLGSKFVEPPVLDIKAVLEESVAQTPLIFVLSPGVDPTTALMQLAESAGMMGAFQSLSLGQGQSPIATRMIQRGAKEGHWVFLANCHLSLSWMPQLDKIVETLQTGKINPRFRLWLSSSPHPEFPISILQAGMKMTTEPPKGLRANLTRLYQLITEEQFSVCQCQEKYKKLLFSLCFFHAILLERKKFQQLGWNVIYSFNDSDFEVSENLLTIYLDEYENTPWDALKYLIAGVNYGGHVTDDWDRRLLLTYINQYFCDDVLNIPYHRLSSLPTYYIPRDGSLQTYQDYVRLLPTIDRPEAFGQHPNADITSLITESRMFCETLMSLEIQSSSGESESQEDKVSQLAAEVLSKIPNPIDYETTEKLIGVDKKPLDVVLLQEILRYNTLLVDIRTSLDELQKGIKGLVVMSSQLEEIFTCIFEGRVPSDWLKAYASLKLLGSWTRDLIARVEHFETWASTTHPPMFFWLSAYTFPTGFLTAVLQTTARANEVPIDTLSWEFTVITVDESQLIERPENGVYVKGMFLEGAGWDRKNACLIEPQPMQLVCAMPVIHFKPQEVLKKKTRGLYSCPCYYFPIRTGAPNRPAFVVAVDLKSGAENADFWIKRGTALLLSLSN
nr:PREDICTED: dynein heavy chain 2, axonemal [Tribolium castaneum]|eukprot:XP_015838947.1 PREDICTED: dynein heavy chain 2, axonemal [Tribolium castaneum]